MMLMQLFINNQLNHDSSLIDSEVSVVDTSEKGKSHVDLPGLDLGSQCHSLMWTNQSRDPTVGLQIYRSFRAASRWFLSKTVPLITNGLMIR